MARPKKVKEVEEEFKAEGGIAVVEEAPEDFSCLKALAGVEQVVSYRLGEKSDGSLILALKSAKEALEQAKRWVKNANAIIDEAKLDCPKL